MIQEMRREFGILAAVLALALLPSQANAQEWEDAPAEESTQNTAPAEEAAAAPTEYEDKDPAALADFNQELAPYGQWRNDPTYGTVWVPNQTAVGKDFAPYVTSGHWAMADDGSWIWVSDLKFGWVVFHYGRWVWINNTGWAWIPGRRYAHAWVVWRVGDPGYDYVGWAPMPPDYIWVNGYAVGVGFGIYTSWVFCPSLYVYHNHVHSYVIHDHAHVHRIAAHTHRYSGGAGVPSWHGPPPKTAHIPAKAIPKKRTAADAKAIAASKDKRPPSAKKVKRPGSAPSTASAKARPTPTRTTRTLPGTSTEPLRSSRPSSSASLVPRTSGPTRSATPVAPTRSGYPTAPQYSAPSRSAPAPTRSATPTRSAPTRSATPTRAAPPSRSQTRSSPPSRSFSPSPPPRPSQGSSPSRGSGGGRRR